METTLVLPIGLEPTTPGLGNLCSIQLSYGSIREATKLCALPLRVSQRAPPKKQHSKNQYRKLPLILSEYNKSKESLSHMILLELPSVQKSSTKTIFLENPAPKYYSIVTST